MVTGYYRWLQRRGGYLWIQSTATVSINHKAPHERNVIWVNYVLRSAQTLHAKRVYLPAQQLGTSHLNGIFLIIPLLYIHTHTFSPDASVNTHLHSATVCAQMSPETKARGLDWISALIGLKLYNYIKWMSEFWC